MKKGKIFIVDSDPVFRAKLGSSLDGISGAEVFTFYSGEECMRFIGSGPDVLVVDYHLESQFKHVLSGLDLLKIVSREHPNVKVIVLSSFNNHNEDLNAASLGAFDYIPKTEENIFRVENTIVNAFKYNLLEDNIKMYRNGLYVTLAFTIVGVLAVGTFLAVKMLHISPLA